MQTASYFDKQKIFWQTGSNFDKKYVILTNIDLFDKRQVIWRSSKLFWQTVDKILKIQISKPAKYFYVKYGAKLSPRKIYLEVIIINK